MERQVADVMGEHLVRVIKQNLPDAARGGSLD
jgi:hypothetical protein